ncbi:MAG: hypothetical protein LPL00_11885 [Alphaproteobacteria bacterium]|nr:hypothetical protein [Alphaproteobacteria bacterium]MDX5370442.1 hypothetical protein [Alphaproteobacteria bacterium]MDX5464948.1 hypothetical protein [Alphaproteobacteria bacterium]
MTTEWTEDEIVAYADGSAEGDAARRAARAVETDPRARAIFQRVREANAMLRAAFDAPMQEAAPAPILAAIHGKPGKVATLPRRGVMHRFVPLAMAASVVLAVGLAVYLQPGLLDRDGHDAAPALALGPVSRDTALATALETRAAGTPEDAVTVLATFRTEGGQVCREFEHMPSGSTKLVAGIACRTPSGWAVEALAEVALATQGGEGYTPASGANDPLASVLAGLKAGPALSASEEARLLRNRWQE